MLPMFRTRVALRIAAGLAMLTVAILLMTATLGIGPNVNREILRRRGSLCETVAISSSLLASRGDWKGLEENLRQVAVRHPDLLSAAVRRGWTAPGDGRRSSGPVEARDRRRVQRNAHACSGARRQSELGLGRTSIHQSARVASERLGGAVPWSIRPSSSHWPVAPYSTSS